MMRKEIKHNYDNCFPHKITKKEWHELSELREVQESWGLDEDTNSEALSQQSYGVKFYYTTDCPGYCGELFILMGGSLDYSSMMMFTRNSKGHLEYCERTDMHS